MEQEQLQGQISIFDLMTGPVEALTGFEQYIGQCQYCMWFGYGLYEQGRRDKRKKGTEHMAWQSDGWRLERREDT